MALGRRFGRGGGRRGGGGGTGVEVLQNALDRLQQEGVLTAEQAERVRQAVKEERQKLRREGRDDGGDGGGDGAPAGGR
jgi:hypothetical protein